MDRVLRLTYSSALSHFREINSSFDTGVLRVAYTNQNRNGSFISKDTYERCMNTIYNCPIVCNYDRETDSIGSHDIEIVTDSDGGMRIVNVTTPVGLVPESATPYWELVQEEDGSIHEYLCVDVLLWKRQEAYRKIKEDGIVAESMEITVKDGGTDKASGYFIIRDFEFTAFCILGDGVEPCFESASLETYSHSEFKAQMAQMMSDLKETFKIDNPDTGIDKHPQISTKGGETLEEKMTVVAEYGIDIDALDFSIDDFSVEELREKFEAMKNAGGSEPIADPEPTPDPDPEPGAGNFALAGQIQETLMEAISVEMVETCFGEMPRYWFVDYDPDVSEVYCYDEKDWRLYGFQYSMNGDNIVVDFESKKRMKFAIVEFDEGEQNDPFASVFEQVTAKYTENDTQWSEKFQSASDQISSMQNDLAELEELRKFKTDAEDAAAQAERDEVFAQFDDLVGVEAFEELRKNCKEFSAEALEEKCYAIRGRLGMHANFSNNGKGQRIVVPKSVGKPEPYGGLFEEYGHRN